MKSAALTAIVSAGVLAGLPVFSLAAMPAYDHVVVVVEENHSLTQIIGNIVDAPYINALAAGGTSFTSFFGLTHPSQPNYLQMFSGSNQNVFDNNVPAGSPFTTPNLGTALRAAQGANAFGGYSESLPVVGSNVSSNGAYQRKHNPWVNWQGAGVNQLPSSVNMPFTSFPADFNLLPKVSFVVPNQQNDMHDGTVKMGDDWLVANISAYANWAKNNNSLLVLTWDEDEKQSGNRIPTVFYGANVRAGHVNDDTWTLHHLQRTLEDLYSAGHSGSSADVRAISSVFTTETPNVTKRFRDGDANGYGGTTDTYIQQSQPGTSFAAAGSVVVDGDTDNDALNGAQVTQGLIRFDDIFGSGPDQIPLGTPIRSAKLVVNTGASSNDVSDDSMSLRRMLVDWNVAANWSGSFGGNGVNADGAESTTAAAFSLIPNVNDAGPTPAIFDVTSTIAAWSSGAANKGWVITAPAAGLDSWSWNSSESGNVASRPYLEISIASVAGDADLDGDVDLSDLGALATYYSTPGGVAWRMGDFDADGDVDLNDLGALASNYGAGAAQALTDFQALSASVPEPASILPFLWLAMTSRRPSRTMPGGSFLPRHIFNHRK